MTAFVCVGAGVGCMEMALRCVENFLEAEEVAAIGEFALVREEELLYSGHRAFVLGTYVDSQVLTHGSVNLDMRDADTLLLNLDAMKTPLADAWRLAGRHRLVYRIGIGPVSWFDPVRCGDICPSVAAWFDTLRYGDPVGRKLTLIKMFRSDLCLCFAKIGFRLERIPDKTLHSLRNLNI